MYTKLSITNVNLEKKTSNYENWGTTLCEISGAKKIRIHVISKLNKCQRVYLKRKKKEKRILPKGFQSHCDIFFSISKWISGHATQIIIKVLNNLPPTHIMVCTTLHI